MFQWIMVTWNEMHSAFSDSPWTHASEWKFLKYKKHIEMEVDMRLIQKFQIYNSHFGQPGPKPSFHQGQIRISVGIEHAFV